MRMSLAMLIALACMTGPALADACIRKDHTTGNVASSALLDGLSGNVIARDMDCEDQPHAARAYGRSFRGPVGHRYEWSRGRNRGYVVTNREYNRGPRLCRDFTQVVYRKGREFDRAGTACRRRDGEWEFLS